MGKTEKYYGVARVYINQMRRAEEKFAPYEEVGVEALEKMTEEAFNLETSPLWEYALEKGLKIINQQLAAKGLSKSGAGMGEIERFTEEMLFQHMDKKWSQWAQLANMSFTATTNTANLIATSASTLLNLYQWSQEMEMAGRQSQANIGMGIGGSMMGMGMSATTAMPQINAAKAGVSMAIPQVQSIAPTMGSIESNYYPPAY